VDNPDEARDIDLACDSVPGWKLYELAARLEEELHAPLDVLPLNPPTRFTRLIEKRGRVLLHGYGFQMDWERMLEGIAGLAEVFSRFKAKLAEYILSL
jgi:hypothetical protein